MLPSTYTVRTLTCTNLELLAGALERADTYNADDSRPPVITQIAVFGSYLRPDATLLGDLDLAVEYVGRRPGSAPPPAALLEHAALPSAGSRT